MLSMQMTAFAETDREALKAALIEYEWRNYTLPETRAKGIENNADLAWIYTSLDEFFNDYCEDNVLSDPLSLIDVNSDSVRNFFDNWTDFLDDWMEEKEELYGEFSVVDAGDTFQIVDAAGNAVEACDKLYQYMYLNDEMSEEDKEFYLNENGGMSDDYNDGIVDGEVNISDGNTTVENSESAANDMASNADRNTAATENYANSGNIVADNANVNNGNAVAHAFSETVEETTEAMTEETEVTEEKGSVAPYVVVSAVVVIAAGVGGYFLYKKKKGV